MATHQLPHANQPRSRHGAHERVRAGRLVLTFAAAMTAISPFVADGNETHIHDKHWPPHARFPNAQTLSMGTLLSAASLYLLWRIRGGARAAVLPAVGFRRLYWVSQAMALVFPGVAWTDPHPARGRPVARAVPSAGPPQLVMGGLMAVGTR